MNIVSTSQILAEYGLNAPILNVLVADDNNYSILLIQPEGKIDADQNGIRNRDSNFSGTQISNFLQNAKEMEADLVIAPEYSIPWKELREVLSNPNKVPSRAKLWVLGCESLKYRELQQFREELSENAMVIFEEMVPNDGRFVDPLVYIFHTTEIMDVGQSRLVVLVQFKTHAMADRHDLERDFLQLGSNIYQFGSYGAGISLTSLICSDVFAVTDNIASRIYDRSLIIHIQLNPDPRHQSFLHVRAKLLGFQGVSTEIICLNWASDVKIWIDNRIDEWRNISGSAWYGKMREFDSDDATLSQNHRRGLYYTNLTPHHAHAMFFNFNPSVYKLTASKVTRLSVPGPVGRRRGPQLNDVYSWNNANHTWEIILSSDDGFNAIIDNCGKATEQVRRIFEVCPLACERLLALCAGNDDINLNWFRPDKLDSFLIDLRELVFRITFCQDKNHDVVDFRLQRLNLCAQLWTILHTQKLPEVLKPGKDGFMLEWTLDAPHQNLRCAGGELATVMYLGEGKDKTSIERAYRNARERIRIADSEEVGDRAKQRVVLWYRDTKGQIQCRWETPLIDRQRNESEYDITREK